MSLKSQLKILQDRKQYAAMIALLEASDEPNRATIIARIQLKMQEAARAEVEVKATATTEPVKVEPVQELPKLRTPPVRRKGGISAERIVVIAVVVLLIVMGGAAFRTYLNRYVDRMANTCEGVFRDDWHDGTYTFNQWWVGCKDAAAAAMDTYGEEIRYCFDSHGQTDKLFMECLVDQEVTLSSTYLRNAPKE